MRWTFTTLLIYKGMFDRMDCPRFQFEASDGFMKMDWKLYPVNRYLPSKTTGKQKSISLEIWREMAREVKLLFLRLKILMYHWYDTVYGDVRRENDKRVSTWGRFPYCPWFFIVNDTKRENYMDEKEQLITSMVAAHECIVERDTLLWIPYT